MTRSRTRQLGMLALFGIGTAGGIGACGDDDVVTRPMDAGTDTAPGDSSTGDGGSDAGLQAIDCEVAIVGGGAGGVHTAYKLTNPPAGTTVTGITAGSGVCVFEKNDYLGGRLKDIQLGPNANDLYGTGIASTRTSTRSSSRPSSACRRSRRSTTRTSACCRIRAAIRGASSVTPARRSSRSTPA